MKVKVEKGFIKRKTKLCITFHYKGLKLCTYIVHNPFYDYLPLFNVLYTEWRQGIVKLAVHTCCAVNGLFAEMQGVILPVKAERGDVIFWTEISTQNKTPILSLYLFIFLKPLNLV